LEYGKLKKDDSVLITAAASTTGLAAIQIAKATGATQVLILHYEIRATHTPNFWFWRLICTLFVPPFCK